MAPHNQFPHDPDYAVPPGRTLRETLTALGMDQRELAIRTGLDKKTVNQIVQGKHPLSQQTAIKLERATGVPARLWNNLEMLYQERKAREEDRRKLEEDLEWLKTIPVKELIERSAIQKMKDKVSQLREVLGFFGVNSVSGWNELWVENLACQFRRSQVFDSKPGATAAWMRLGEIEAQRISCLDFNREEFQKALKQIRNLTVESPEVWQPEVLNLCAKAGVAVAMIREIKGCPASGLTRWLSPRKALIQLSLRYKRDDQFWFTFFHEAGHILDGHKKEIILESNHDGDEEEESANRFATDFLIPRERQAELRNLRSKADVTRFASTIGIAPGIVVGQLQKRKIIPYNQLNSLRVALAWAQE